MRIFIIILLVIVAFSISVKLSNSAIAKFASSRSVSPYRTKYIAKTISMSLMVFYSILLITFLGVEYSQISIFLSSIFAVLGVALFAQWSILSNITASLVIFFGFPYRVGDRIRVVDKDDDIAGVIEEITLFHVLIKKGNELITYPNTLILQKAVIKESDLDASSQQVKGD
ncbi:mechanosensitive ion channel domain-containing protein [Agarilytica rhodophyticola]|uniref:mechanosensitive ion channel domain-containing protein n=1 Tax=Agarilytica rhodophyticola TaxID=1737490 RepID=UPI000B3486F4|nr:mechanosensitive ion channel domain-containing protein [Agarilytica rhodophyticola]